MNAVLPPIIYLMTSITVLKSGNDTGVGLGYPHLPSAREKTSSPDIGMKRSRKPGARGKTIDDSPKATATARGLLLAVFITCLTQAQQP